MSALAERAGRPAAADAPVDPDPNHGRPGPPLDGDDRDDDHGYTYDDRDDSRPDHHRRADHGYDRRDGDYDDGYDGYDDGYGDDDGGRGDAGDRGRDDHPSDPPDRAVAQPRTAMLRADFAAHLDAEYPRLVAQLYAITLDAREAHDTVQDAYSRAWRRWAELAEGPDPAAWVRRVAVRSTIRSWRRLRQRLRPPHPTRDADDDPRSAALLTALARLGPAQRRAAVLHHMAGCAVTEIAGIEQVGVEVVRTRLAAARDVLAESLADDLPAVLGPPSDGYHGADLDEHDDRRSRDDEDEDLGTGTDNGYASHYDSRYDTEHDGHYDAQYDGRSDTDDDHGDDGEHADHGRRSGHAADGRTR